MTTERVIVVKIGTKLWTNPDRTQRLIPKNCIVGYNTHIDRNAFIGKKNVKIGNNCFIAGKVRHDSTIGNDVTIGKGARVGPCCNIGDGAIITKDTTLCNYADVEEGEIVSETMSMTTATG